MSKQTKRARHDYTDEENKWMKDCVLPNFSDKPGIKSLTEAFNTTFNTTLGVKAFYTHVAKLQGKWVGEKSLEAKTQKSSQTEKRHIYPPVQLAWLESCTLPPLGSEKLKQLTTEFNNRFKTNISPRGLYAKAARIKGQWNEDIHNQSPSATKKSKAIKKQEGVVFKEELPLHSPTDDMFKDFSAKLTGLNPLPPAIVTADGKFKVIINGNVVWTGDTKPSIDTGPVYVVVINGEIFTWGVNKFNVEVVQKV